jgi:hypothetical protein
MVRYRFAIGLAEVVDYPVGSIVGVIHFAGIGERKDRDSRYYRDDAYNDQQLHERIAIRLLQSF